MLLGDGELVALWEACGGLDRPERALVLLAAATPELQPDARLDLPLGVRDARLLVLREELFGRAVPCRVPCPACREPMEFSLDTVTLRDRPPTPVEVRVRLASAVVSAVIRPVRVRDLLPVGGAPALTRSRVLADCVLQVWRGGESVSVDVLSGAEADELVVLLGEADPGAETLLDLTCAACGHAWQVPFDIVEYLWAEIAFAAERLLENVHTLACAYHWSEDDILRLSPRRRRWYLARALA